WKMHKTVDEAVDLAVGVVEATNGCRAEVLVCPPFTALDAVAEIFDGRHVHYGAHDLCWEDSGAFTGAVSGAMLADICCDYVIVGHSERCTLFCETDEVVAKKLQAAYRNNLKPILCVGENLKERRAKATDKKIVAQLTSALKKLTKDQAAKLTVAYEPLWAIGTGKAATVADAVEVVKLIRAQLAKLKGEDVARKVRILYGGSVKADNAKDFADAGIDGVLVGGASLKVDDFAAIVRAF
ncbi:MAG: triose-phosphate isomerase, partial [Phascolarctobacterium sp.]|nr:triose-phosphate isomerase [Candidatus Phascolarctobacterium equi]